MIDWLVMKLRIRGNSVRVRLTRTEISELVETSSIENRVQLGAQPECALVYRLELSGAAAKPETVFQKSQICIRLPLAEAMAWAHGGAVGIYSEEAWGLKLAIEKDFKCLESRPDEDDSDAFENPNGPTHAACSND